MNLNFNESVFDEFPVLQTERLVLRKIRYEDSRTLFDIFSDPEVVKYFGKHRFRSMREAEEMVEKVTNAFANKEGIRWGITFKESDELIGSGGFWRILKDHLRSEIGYDLNRKYWNKGIMTEAINAMTEFGFNKMNLHTIEANIDPANKASEKLLEKTGFKKEGHTTKSYLFDGKFTDTGIYSLVRKDI